MAAPHADYDYLIKLLLIGDSGVGKTCLISRFYDGNFTPNFISTIGVDFKIRTIEVDQKRIKLQIWDTAGQERFQTITTAFYRGASGILLVYDVSDESSFNNIRKWIRDIGQHASDNVNKILVGNKADMDENARAVSTLWGQELADEYGIRFFETSALTNMNVEPWRMPSFQLLEIFSKGLLILTRGQNLRQSQSTKQNKEPQLPKTLLAVVLKKFVF